MNGESDVFCYFSGILSDVQASLCMYFPTLSSILLLNRGNIGRVGETSETRDISR